MEQFDIGDSRERTGFRANVGPTPKIQIALSRVLGVRARGEW